MSTRPPDPQLSKELSWNNSHDESVIVTCPLRTGTCSGNVSVCHCVNVMATYTNLAGVACSTPGPCGVATIMYALSLARRHCENCDCRTGRGQSQKSRESGTG